jgi:pimeloyl-ACP methyl ester carboxylesterase
VKAGDGHRERSALLPFLAGVLAGSAGAVLARSFLPRRVFDPRLLRHSGGDVPQVVVVPGILGCELSTPLGARVWLNVGNAFGTHALGLPATLPPEKSRDGLVPGGLLGVDTALPRLFGFPEYSDLVTLLTEAGFKRGGQQQVFRYDWRLDLIESAKALYEMLETLAAGERNHPGFTIIGHSMGGLVARYCLRYGNADPGGSVTWAGARFIKRLVLVATPSGGSLPALGALLFGERVGLSSTTLASTVITRMPSIYSLLPPPGVHALVNDKGDALDDADLLDAETWKRFRWGPFAPTRRSDDDEGQTPPREALQEFLAGCLVRARILHESLARTPESPCPSRVLVVGGDCLPTLARLVLTDRPGVPRFHPRTRRDSELMFESGDGRVTRASALASHLPDADPDTGCGIPEARQIFFGDTDHHGIYGEVTFQSLLLRLLLRPIPRPGVVETSLSP